MEPDFSEKRALFRFSLNNYLATELFLERKKLFFPFVLVRRKARVEPDFREKRALFRFSLRNIKALEHFSGKNADFC